MSHRDRPPPTKHASDSVPDEPSTSTEVNLSATTIILGSSVRPESLADPSELDALVADLVLPIEGRLEHVRDIAEGGMGAVQCVVDRALGRRAAKKVIRPEIKREPIYTGMFLREAQIVSQLDHPNIVPVHDIGFDDRGNLYFTMKLVEGRTLSELIRELPGGPIEPGTLFTLLEVVVKVCDALGLAHSRGVLHCDIKPDNIMVGDFGAVYLMDWGIAQVVPRGDGHANVDPAAPHLRDVTPDHAFPTGGNTSAGTLAYMSPEQARRDPGKLSHATDIFCVGGVLYEILVRRSPYGGHRIQAAIESARKGCFPPPESVVGETQVPPGLRAIIMRAMAPDPNDRYAHIEALKDDLVQFLRGGSAFARAHFSPGACIVREGECGDEAFIIDSGQCEVFSTVDGEETVIRRLGPGELFGETVMLSPGPRLASVRAINEVTVQVVTRTILERELEAMRPWMAVLVRTLAERFREADRARSTTAVSSLELVKHTVMYLHTWGERGPDGELSVPFDALCQELWRHYGADLGRLRSALEGFGGFCVDVESNRVTASSPTSLACRVASSAAP